MVLISCFTDRCAPRLIGFSASNAKKRSTGLIQDDEVGVKCLCQRGRLANQSFDQLRFVARGIVHDDVDVETLGHVALDFVEELAELARSMARPALTDHGASLDVRRCRDGRDTFSNALSAPLRTLKRFMAIYIKAPSKVRPGTAHCLTQMSIRAFLAVSSAVNARPVVHDAISARCASPLLRPRKSPSPIQPPSGKRRSPQAKKATFSCIFRKPVIASGFPE